MTCALAFRRLSPPRKMEIFAPLILWGTGFYPHLRYFYFLPLHNVLLTTSARKSQAARSCHLANFKISTTYTPSSDNNFLTPSLVVTVRYSVPISCYHLTIYSKAGTKTLFVVSEAKDNGMGHVTPRTAIGGKGSCMLISCVAFGCTNMQNCRKSQEYSGEEGKHVSCDKGSQERVHVAFQR